VADGPVLLWERVAITREQIERYDLPVIVKTDRRYKGRRGRHEAVETEAIGQRILIETLRARLLTLMPEPPEAVHEREEAEREIIRRLLEEDDE
jgi:hypothetical protein